MRALPAPLRCEGADVLECVAAKGHHHHPLGALGAFGSGWGRVSPGGGPPAPRVLPNQLCCSRSGSNMLVGPGVESFIKSSCCLLGLGGLMRVLGPAREAEPWAGPRPDYRVKTLTLFTRDGRPPPFVKNHSAASPSSGASARPTLARLLAVIYFTEQASSKLN